MTDPRQIPDIVRAVDPLSDLPRTGWLLRGVRPCESIADHSFGVAFIVMLLVDAMRERGETIDGERAIRMALVHDAPEAKTGDIPMPHKTPALREALHEADRAVAQRLLPPMQLKLWEELEAKETLEARVVAAADKLHLVIKLTIYERHGHDGLEEFWDNPGNFRDHGIEVAKAAFEAVAAGAGRAVPR